MPSTHFLIVTKPPKASQRPPAPQLHVCDVAGCKATAVFGEGPPMRLVMRWFCIAHAPAHFNHRTRPARAAFRLDDEAAA